MIRAATVADHPALQEIEIAAGARSRPSAADVAAHDPFSFGELDAYAAACRGWVAADEHGTVIGDAVADVLDGNGHVEQVSVRPEEQGRGTGCACGATSANGGARPP